MRQTAYRSAICSSAKEAYLKFSVLSNYRELHTNTIWQQVQKIISGLEHSKMQNRIPAY